MTRSRASPCWLEFAHTVSTSRLPRGPSRRRRAARPGTISCQLSGTTGGTAARTASGSRRQPRRCECCARWPGGPFGPGWAGPVGLVGPLGLVGALGLLGSVDPVGWAQGARWAQRARLDLEKTSFVCCGSGIAAVAAGDGGQLWRCAPSPLACVACERPLCRRGGGGRPEVLGPRGQGCSSLRLRGAWAAAPMVGSCHTDADDAQCCSLPVGNRARASAALAGLLRGTCRHPPRESPP